MSEINNMCGFVKGSERGQKPEFPAYNWGYTNVNRGIRYVPLML